MKAIVGPLAEQLMAADEQVAATAMASRQPQHVQLQAVYNQGIEEGLALALRDPEAGREVLRWIDQHVWGGAGKAEAAGRDAGLDQWVVAAQRERATRQ